MEGREISHRTSGNRSFHVKFSWRLNEPADGAATNEAGSLFQNFQTRHLKNFERVQSSIEHFVNNPNISSKAATIEGLHT